MPTNNSLVTSLIRGPAQVEWKGCTFWSQGDIHVKIQAELDDLLEDSDGYVDELANDVLAQVVFVPAGQLTAPLISALFPYMAGVPLPGSSLVGTSGSTLSIYAKAGTAYTFPNVVMTQMPALHVGKATSDSSQPEALFGPVTFTVLRASQTTWAAAGSLWSEASAVYPGDSGFLSCNEISSPALGTFVATQGGQSLGPFSSPTGFKIESKLDLVPVVSDAYGVSDFTINAIHLTCKCQPAQLATSSGSLGPSPSVIDTLFAIQGNSGAIRGASRTLVSGTLKVWMNGLYVQMESMAIREQSFLFGQKLRQGEIVFEQTSDSTPSAHITTYPKT